MFKIGDVVMLLSGGPPMTIVAASGGMLYVAWIAAGVPHTAQYPTSCVQPAVAGQSV